MAGKNTIMSVQISKGVIKESPSMLAKTITEVKYGDRLTVLVEQGEWRKVATADGTVSGWIHSSALTSKRIVLASGSKDAQIAASSEEMAMAGKGFNSDVEKEFKDKNKNIDFSWVDKMETFSIPYEEIIKFLETGGIRAEGGSK